MMKMMKKLSVPNGYFYEGFTFDMFFCLHFRGADGQINVRIYSDYYVNTPADWARKVENFSECNFSSDPNDPVLAFVLACIRWSDSHQLQGIYVTDDELVIAFANGLTLHISHSDDKDDAWTVEKEAFVPCGDGRKRETELLLSCDNVLAGSAVENGLLYENEPDNH